MNWLKFTALVLAGAYAFPAFAEREGNGGGFIVCRDQERKIHKIESYDLWRGRSEGVMIGGKRVMVEVRRHNDTSAKEQVYAAADKIKKYNSIFYRTVFKPILDGIVAKIDEERAKPQTMRPPRKQDFDPEGFPTEDFCPGGKILPEFETAILYLDSGRLGQNLEYVEKYFQVLKEFARERSGEKDPHGSKFAKYFVERINAELFDGKPVIHGVCDGMLKTADDLGFDCYRPWLGHNSADTPEDFVKYAAKVTGRSFSKGPLSAFHPAEFQFDRLRILTDVLNDTEHKTETDLAAAYLHETGYKYLRIKDDEEKADRVNQFVTVLMSDLPLKTIHEFIKGYIEAPTVAEVRKRLTLDMLAVKSVEEARERAARSEWIENEVVKPELQGVFNVDTYWMAQGLVRQYYCHNHQTLLILAAQQLNLPLVEYLVKEAKVDIRQKVTWGADLGKRLVYVMDEERTLQSLAKDAKAKGKDQKTRKAKILELIALEEEKPVRS